MHTRKRMIDPSLVSDSDLDTLEKQVLFLTLNHFAEDSGCLILDLREIRKAAFPQQPQVSISKVEQMVRELDEAAMIWTYEIADTKCAYIPKFASWNSSRSRQNAPEAVPIPEGIIYEAFASEKRRGSGRYHYPATRKDLEKYWYVPNGGEVLDEDIEF